MVTGFSQLVEIMKRALKSDPVKLFVKDKVYWDYVGRVTTPVDGSVYVYIDGETSYVKLGDGNAYLIDLPVVYNCTKQYMLTLINELKESIE